MDRTEFQDFAEHWHLPLDGQLQKTSPSPAMTVSCPVTQPSNVKRCQSMSQAAQRTGMAGIET
jgi:hypothetical protein